MEYAGLDFYKGLCGLVLDQFAIDMPTLLHAHRYVTTIEDDALYIVAPSGKPLLLLRMEYVNGVTVLHYNISRGKGHPKVIFDVVSCTIAEAIFRATNTPDL